LSTDRVMHNDVMHNDIMHDERARSCR
jgi:hypothetical protein